MRLLRLSFALVSLLLATAPSANASAQGLLFEISQPAKEGQTGTGIHLYFTLAAAKADFYPLPADVAAAYKTADSIAVEADISDEHRNNTASASLRYGKKDHIKKHLSPATWASLNKMLGKQAQQFQSYHPVSVAMGLRLSAAMDLGYQEELAADLHFIRAARHDAKQIIELDTISARNQRLASLSNKEADAYLSATLKAYQNGQLNKDIQDIELAWRQADPEALGTALSSLAKRDLGSQKIYALMITERNAEIANQLLKAAEQGKKIFAVVDAARLSGEESILSVYKNQGFEIKQIKP